MTAAVQDALWGSTAITTRSVDADTTGGVPPSYSQTVNAGRAHQLSALQASLQPLPANGADPGRKPSKSQPDRAAGMRASDPEPAPKKSGLQTPIPDPYSTSWYG